MISVVVNGKTRDIAERSTVRDLVEALGFGHRQVVVEHNGEPVERRRFGDVTLASGDRVEIVRPVQGG